MDCLITLLVAVPLTAFITLLMASCRVIERENEAYMEGYNAGYTEGHMKGYAERE